MSECSGRRRAYDLAIIGAGPAGEKAAAHAAYFGRSVALIEQRRSLGGAAVSNGGIPSKTLRETALYVSGFGRREVYGVGLDTSPRVALAVLRERTRQVVDTMERLVRANMQRHGVDVVHARARLVGPHTLSLERAGDTSEVEAEAIVVATGSRPQRPPDIPFDDPDVHDSETILTVDKPFTSAVIVGGGAIACEYASIMAMLGVEVTLVNGHTHILGMADVEMSMELDARLRASGVTIRNGTRVESVVRRERRLRLRLDGGEELAPNKLLVAVGRSANSDDLGLEDVGIKVGKRGRILVDGTLCTSVPGIYAACDVIGPPGLASAAIEQGRLAASAACGTSYAGSNSYVGPSAVYTVPEVAWVGLTEEKAREQGVAYEVGRAGFENNARANVAGVVRGRVKILFDPHDRRLLGAHAVCEPASEIIHVAQALIQLGGGLDYLVHGTFNMPTWSDAFKAAAFDGLGRVESTS